MTAAENADTVREALHTLTAASFGEPDAAAMHENSLNGYAALDALVAQAETAEHMASALEKIAYSSPANNPQGIVNAFREIAAVELARYQTGDSPHNKERPRNVGASGAAT